MLADQPRKTFCACATGLGAVESLRAVGAGKARAHRPRPGRPCPGPGKAPTIDGRQLPPAGALPAGGVQLPVALRMSVRAKSSPLNNKGNPR